MFAAFFLISLVASAFVEIMSTILKKRSTDLDDVLNEMLSAGSTNGIDFKGTSIYRAMQAASGASSVKLLRSSTNERPSRLPSYMSARSFADGVIEGLVKLKTGNRTTAEVVSTLPDGPLKERITTLLAEMGDDVVAVKAGLEGWFDDTMDRLEGAFKRWSQWWLLGVGLVLALILNVSAVRIVDSLWNDATLRTAVAESAVNVTDRPCPDAQADCTPEDKVEKAIADLSSLRLPIGWAKGWSNESGWFWTLLGTLITGLAVVLGAPFWFDLLTRLAGIRAGRGVPPRAASDPASATLQLAQTAGMRAAPGFSAL
ncbi:MAG: hypothetical protein ACRD12_24025 [Acidimicrobiales bacterium]